MPVRLGYASPARICQSGSDPVGKLLRLRGVSLSNLAASISPTSSWLQWTLWGLLMSLVMGWVARSRSRPRPAGAARRLQHPISTLIIGVAGFLLFAAIAVISNVFANATTSWKTTTIFVGFALLALPILGDYFAARHEVSDEGLRYGRLFGPGGYMRWTEVKCVRFSETMKWFRLESQSGKVVRLSVMLMGLPTFAQLLLAHAPPQSIERNTLPVLQTTAEGNPPSVWGAPQNSTYTD
jgi:hypothetical protein